VSRYKVESKPENGPDLPQLMLESVARIRVQKRTETVMGSESAKTVTSLLPQPSVLAVRQIY
jgi:hypothetical protein